MSWPTFVGLPASLAPWPSDPPRPGGESPSSGRDPLSENNNQKETVMAVTTLGIMQPYLFPYIGYFQLIGAVDHFVIHDDVQWIKGGWINRNRILVQGQPQYITLPVQKAGSSLNINQREFPPDIEEQKKKTLRQIEAAYRKAPYFEPVCCLLRRCFALQENNVSRFVVHTLRECCGYLGICTPFSLSSELDKRNELAGEERVLDINRAIGAAHYINPIGGTDLYSKAHFSERGLGLSFIRARETPYRQLQSGPFVPFLSIVDVMMFNSQQESAALLKEYDLI
jgi:hypothetical protein